MLLVVDEKKRIRIGEKEFRIFIRSDKIREAVKRIAVELNREHENDRPLFVTVLNGAFLFAADLLKDIKIECEISFVKLSSYSGTSSTGIVKELVGLSENIEGRTVIVLEDIVDTGVTLESVYRQLKKLKPKKLKVAALLFKPKAYSKKIKVDHVGIEVGNEFLVGYGLDHNGSGRNLQDIYVESSD